MSQGDPVRRAGATTDPTVRAATTARFPPAVDTGIQPGVHWLYTNHRSRASRYWNSEDEGPGETWHDNLTTPQSSGRFF